LVNVTASLVAIISHAVTLVRYKQLYSLCFIAVISSVFNVGSVKRTKEAENEDKLFWTRLPTRKIVLENMSKSASYPMGTRVPSLGIKRPGREADHSPPYNAEVENAWV